MPPALDDIWETHQPIARGKVKKVEQKVPQKEVASAQLYIVYSLQNRIINPIRAIICTCHKRN